MSALTLGLVAAFAWGFHDICVRMLSQKVPLLASLLTVLVVGAAFQLVLVVGSGESLRIPSEAMWLAVLSGVFFLMASLGLYGAFQRGPVWLVSPIIASYPIFSVAWAVFSGVEIGLWQWGAVGMIILGVSVVAILSDETAGDIPPKGPTIAMAALSAVGFAGTFAIGQHATEIAGELPVTMITRVVSVTLLLAILAVWRLPFWPGARAVPVLALMGLADGVALLCVLSAGGLPDAQYAAVASSIFGLLTIIMAWAFLRERMTVAQWAGCAVAFAGIGYLAL